MHSHTVHKSLHREFLFCSNLCKPLSECKCSVVRYLEAGKFLSKSWFDLCLKQIQNPAVTGSPRLYKVIESRLSTSALGLSISKFDALDFIAYACSHLPFRNANEYSENSAAMSPKIELCPPFGIIHKYDRGIEVYNSIARSTG